LHARPVESPFEREDLVQTRRVEEETYAGHEGKERAERSEEGLAESCHAHGRCVFARVVSTRIPGRVMASRRPRKARRIPQQERSRILVDAILTAGARVLAEDGYSRARTARIARVAGVSEGSLYQYFPTKDALVIAVMRRHVDRMMVTFEDGLPELAFLPLRQAVRGIVLRTLRAHDIDPALHRVLFREVRGRGRLPFPAQFDERLTAVIRGYLEFHRHEVRPSDLDLAARLLKAAVEAVADVLSADGATAFEAGAEETTALVLGYLAR
jgi:AcrR family transcriptional regulator